MPLGVRRGLLEGRIEGDAGFSFVTHTAETAGTATSTVVHRYRGTLSGDQIRFVMQTEGSSSPHVPVQFVAQRVAAESEGAAVAAPSVRRQRWASVTSACWRCSSTATTWRVHCSRRARSASVSHCATSAITSGVGVNQRCGDA